MGTTTDGEARTIEGDVEFRHIDFRAMGSGMRAVLAGRAHLQSHADDARRGGPGADDDALAHVADWFAEWESHLSRFRGDSELARLNAAAGRRTAVSEVLWGVLQAALGAARATNGLVTPTLLDAVERAGYDRSFEQLGNGSTVAGRASDGPAPDGIIAVERIGGRARPASTVRADGQAGWRAIRTVDADRTVTLPAGVRLDLGGIAKGWAADEAARRLAVHGPALVDAGGDIAVSGPLPDGGRWPIAVGDPRAPDAHLTVLWLAGGGVATSGTDVKRWQRNGDWQHHIIDPRTGAPAVTDVLSATVVARSTRVAETAAKAVLLLGRRAGMAWIERQPALAGILVGSDGEVHASRRLACHLGG